MKIEIVATQHCSHCSNLERDLKELGIYYQVLYVEEHPELVERLGIRSSPSLLVNHKLVFQGQPSEGQLKKMLQQS